MTLFFFYQYNDTQLSCVFEKKNAQGNAMNINVWQVISTSFYGPT